MSLYQNPLLDCKLIPFFGTLIGLELTNLQAMLDLKEIRKNPEFIEKKLQTKDPEASLNEVLFLDEKLRAMKTSSEELKSQKNGISKEIGIKKRKGEDSSSFGKKLEELSTQIASFDAEIPVVEERLQDLLSRLPNIPFDEVPISPDPKDNKCIKQFKEKPSFSFAPKNHVELNEKLQYFDFPRAAKISGSGWTLYKGKGAELEWALLNYMLDTHRKNGFTQVMPPLLTRKETMYASGQLPKFGDQLFQINDKDFELYLIPTSETALVGLHSGETLEEEALPLYYTAYTPCFRREAGAAGSQERGLIRTHQFNKVELFALSTPEESDTVYETMLASAEEVLQGLDIHYRSMLLTTGDMSFQSAKTIDLEAWLPGQNRYYEVSSVSNCTDYQGRRANIKCKKKGEKGRFVHLLNGSGLATSRLMVALLENNQREDGSIEIPKVLEKYLKRVS